MADVAALAGVALKSVSRVINNEMHVSPRLRSRVEAAIAELNYVPDAAARTLAGGRSFTVSVLFGQGGVADSMNVATGAYQPCPNYVTKVVAGAYQACAERQYKLQIDQIKLNLPHSAMRRQFDLLLRNSRGFALILTPPLTDNEPLLDYLDAHGLKYARLAPASSPDRSPRAWIDDAAAGAMIADYLWSRGHRRLGLVNGPLSHSAAINRRQGFIDRVKTLDPAAIVDEVAGDFTFETGIVAGTALLAKPARPTAIFATNDDSACGVMVACRQFGLEIPRDISICGFDDSGAATSVWPYLTTVRQPIEEMAYAATCMLIGRGTPETGSDAVQLDFRLIERDSVANAP